MWIRLTCVHAQHFIRINKPKETPRKLLQTHISIHKTCSPTKVREKNEGKKIEKNKIEVYVCFVTSNSV